MLLITLLLLDEWLVGWPNFMMHFQITKFVGFMHLVSIFRSYYLISRLPIFHESPPCLEMSVEKNVNNKDSADFYVVEQKMYLGSTKPLQLKDRQFLH